MRRLLLIALLLTPGLAFGQDIGTIRYQGPGVSGLTSTSSAITSTVPLLLPDGTVGAPALAFSGLTTMGLFRNSNDFNVAIGGATVLRVGGASLTIDVGTPEYQFDSSRFYVTNDTLSLGLGTFAWKEFYVLRSIQGSKSKALTEGAATTMVTVAVPQTAGSNFAAGEFKYTVYASDGTDSQALNGVAKFSAVNKAGTETCTLEDDQITDEAASAGTLACTVTCVVGLTDVVGLALDCTSSLTQTTLNGLYRLDMQQVNTVAPQ